MATLEIRLLGAPRVSVEGVEVTISQQKALALLAYLAMERRPHRRDALAGLLWPDDEQGRARAELRRMLWALNKALGKGWLDADRHTIALETEADVWADVERLRQLEASWQAHGHEADLVCARCLDLLAEAANLYQGEFLAGFSVSGSGPFEQWQRQEGQRLQQVAGRALDKLVCWHLARGEVALDPLQRLALQRLALEPAHEPAHRLLIALQGQAGQVAGAQEQYRLCVCALEEELAFTPSEETQQLLRRIRHDPSALSWQDVTAAWSLPYRVATVPAAEGAVNIGPGERRAAALPAPITPFVGRQTQIATLVDLLGDPAIRLVSIVAPGGMGKTRLALEVGRRLQAEFTQGVFFVELAPLKESERIISAIAEATGYQFQQSGRDQKRQVLDYLANKEMLLLLDNLEHLLQGRALIGELLAAAPRLKVLVTSRRRLNAVGETLFSLGGMGVPGWQSLADAFNYEAVMLFRQSARRVAPTFSLNAQNLADVVEICHLVGGMPLGILLAASWIPILAPAAIVAEIQKGLDILEVEEGEVLARQRSLRAVLASSWQMLAPGERQAFMKLSLFRGGFTRAAAEKVAGAGLHTLHALVNKSLVYRGEDGRYQVHELLRQYGEERLRHAGKQRDAQRRHTAFFLEELARQTPRLKGAKQLATLKAIEADFENMRQAWLDAAARQQGRLLGAALEGMYLFCHLQSRLEDGKALFDRARAGLAPVATKRSDPVWHRLRIRFYNAQEAPAHLKERLHRALQATREAGDEAEAAFCLHTLGTIAHYMEQRASEAVGHYEASAAAYRRLGERYYLAQTLSKLGEAYQLLGQTEKTVALVNEAYRLQQAQGDRLGASETLRALAMTAFVQGDYESMVSYQEKAYAIQQETNFLVGQATSQLYLGWVRYLGGDLDGGRRQVESALQLARDVADASTQAWCYTKLSLFASCAGRYQAGREWLARAEALDTDPFRQTGAGNPFLQMTINWAHAVLAFAKGDVTTGRQKVALILDLAWQTESRPYLTFFLALVAMLRRHEGQAAEAAALLALVRAQPEAITSWMEAWVGFQELRRRLRQELGEEAFAVAWEQGRSWQLLEVADVVCSELVGKVPAS